MDSLRSKKLAAEKLAAGFTLVELLVVIAIIGILAALLLPVLNKSQMRAKRIWCENNLRQQGIAFHVFAHDHNSLFPMAVRMADGGSLEFIENGYLINGPFYFSYHHFQVMSNLLVSTKLVVCPMDITRPAAVDFGTMQNSNLSYFVGADADYNKPMSILAGDRNLVPTAQSPTIIYDNAGARLQWDDQLHDKKGNVLFADAHVEEWGDSGNINTLADSENFVLPSSPAPGSPGSPGSPGGPAPHPVSPPRPPSPGPPSPAPTVPSSPSGGNPSPAPSPTPVSSPPGQPVQPSDASTGPMPSPANASGPSQPMMPPMMPQYASSVASGGRQQTPATSDEESAQFTNRLAATNLGTTHLTNFSGAPIPTNASPAPTPPPQSVKLQKIVAWILLFLLLVLLLLMYIAYQTWKATKEAEKKKKRR